MTALQEQFMGPYERWQLENYGNVLPSPENISDDEVFESGIAELERMAEYIDQHAELEILNFQL